MHKQKFYIILSIFCSFFVGIAQIDTLNKFDSNGKKTGYWKVFLDERVCLVKDSNEASFYGFQYYRKGQNIGSYYRKKPSYKNHSYFGKSIKKGRPQLLDGKFTFYDTFGRKVTEEFYSEGRTLLLRSFNYKTGYRDRTDTIANLHEEVDYSKKYNGAPFTHLITLNERGKSKTWWFRDGEKGWQCYPTNK